MDSFYSEIKKEITNETIIERSKFICLIKRVETEEEAREVLSFVKKNHPFATHNCYAFILRSGAARFSDDGEPQGTAGQPMLEAIKNNGLYNVIAVVTRYFGGIKLGASGLVGAYTRATVECLEKSTIKEMETAVLVKIAATFSEWAQIETSIKKFAAISNTEYGDGVVAWVYVKPDNLDAFLSDINSRTSGKVKTEILEKTYYGF